MELAHGTFLIAVSNMTRAIRSVSTERGKDPRDYDLIAFGGNGGIFAAAVARELELPTIDHPARRRHLLRLRPALFRTRAPFHPHPARPHRPVEPGTPARPPGRHSKTRRVQTLAREGFPPMPAALTRIAELRYLSQTHELAVAWPADADRRARPADARRPLRGCA